MYHRGFDPYLRPPRETKAADHDLILQLWRSLAGVLLLGVALTIAVWMPLGGRGLGALFIIAAACVAPFDGRVALVFALAGAQLVLMALTGAWVGPTWRYDFEAGYLLRNGRAVAGWFAAYRYVMLFGSLAVYTFTAYQVVAALVAEIVEPTRRNTPRGPVKPPEDGAYLDPYGRGWVYAGEDEPQPQGRDFPRVDLIVSEREGRSQRSKTIDYLKNDQWEAVAHHVIAGGGLSRDQLFDGCRGSLSQREAGQLSHDIPDEYKRKSGRGGRRVATQAFVDEMRAALESGVWRVER